MERGNSDDDEEEEEEEDDDGCVLTGQSQIIRSDMLYDCGER